MNPSTNATTIEALPSEMINELFKLLGLKDLLACSVVNKRWHWVYTHLAQVARLVVTNDVHDPNMKWCHSNRAVSEKEICPFQIFARLADQPLLVNLKHLALWSCSPEFDVDKLNQFSQLLHLEVDVESLGEFKVSLHLPRLQVLAFRSNGHHLSIDCPELQVLLYDREPNGDHLDVKHPETIRKLAANLLAPKLIPFKSVECLVTREFRMISKDTVESLPALKELHFNVNFHEYFHSNRNVRSIDEIQQTLSGFLGDLQKMRKRQIKFTFAGLRLSKGDVIDFGWDPNRQFQMVLNERIYMKNYGLIDPDAELDFIHTFNYNEMMKNVTGEFPPCFDEKFKAITQIDAWNDVHDEDHFLWFLKSLKSVRKLELGCPGLSQYFYDQLPEAAPLLTQLTLIDDLKEDVLELNLDFIGRFPRLKRFESEQALTFSSISSLADHFDKLKEGCINFSLQLSGMIYQTFYIEKSAANPSAWKVYETSEKILLETNDPDEILNYLEGQQPSDDEVDVLDPEDYFIRLG